MQVDGVLASDNIGDGGTASLGLLGLLGGGHFYVVVGREGGMLVEMLFVVVAEMDFRKIFPRSWRNPKRALAILNSHVRPPNLVDHQSTSGSSSPINHSNYIFCEDGAAGCKSCISGRKKQTFRKLELWVVKAVSVKLDPA